MKTCIHCGYKWKSRVNNPIACPAKGCRSRIWFREKSKVRIISDKEKNRLSKISGNRKGTKQTPDHIIKRILTGDKHPNWKGGITPFNEKVRKSHEYKDWRYRVFERDNWTCTNCGARSGNGKTIYLEADHIKPFSLYPDLRFDIDNGRTLCKKCHDELGWNICREMNPNKYLKK